MKAQLSIEFLFEFLILISVIALLLTTLQKLEIKTKLQANQQNTIAELESNARAIDILTSSFPHGHLNLESVYRLDKNRLLVKQGNEWLVAETLYGEENEKEPI